MDDSSWHSKWWWQLLIAAVAGGAISLGSVLGIVLASTNWVAKEAIILAGGGFRVVAQGGIPKSGSGVLYAQCDKDGYVAIGGSCDAEDNDAQLYVASVTKDEKSFQCQWALKTPFKHVRAQAICVDSGLRQKTIKE